MGPPSSTYASEEAYTELHYAVFAAISQQAPAFLLSIKTKIEPMLSRPVRVSEIKTVIDTAREDLARSLCGIGFQNNGSIIFSNKDVAHFVATQDFSQVERIVEQSEDNKVNPCLNDGIAPDSIPVEKNSEIVHDVKTLESEQKRVDEDANVNAHNVDQEAKDEIHKEDQDKLCDGNNKQDVQDNNIVAENDFSDKEHHSNSTFNHLEESEHVDKSQLNATDFSENEQRLDSCNSEHGTSDEKCEDNLEMNNNTLVDSDENEELNTIESKKASVTEEPASGDFAMSIYQKPEAISPQLNQNASMEAKISNEKASVDDRRSTFFSFGEHGAAKTSATVHPSRRESTVETRKSEIEAENSTKIDISSKQPPCDLSTKAAATITNDTQNLSKEVSKNELSFAVIGDEPDSWKPALKTAYSVTISHATDPNDFYLVRDEREDDKMFFENLKVWWASVRLNGKIHVTPSVVEAGLPVVVVRSPSIVDRGIVVSKDKNAPSVVVRLLDRGGVERVGISRICRIKKSLAKYPALAIQCTIDITSNEHTEDGDAVWPSQVQNSLRRAVEKKTKYVAFFYDIYKMKNTVNLFLPKYGYDEKKSFMRHVSKYLSLRQRRSRTSPTGSISSIFGEGSITTDADMNSTLETEAEEETRSGESEETLQDVELNMDDVE